MSRLEEIREANDSLPCNCDARRHLPPERQACLKCRTNELFAIIDEIIAKATTARDNCDWDDPQYCNCHDNLKALIAEIEKMKVEV